MLTVLEALKKSTNYLEHKGIDSPRINSELLLADILHCKRLELYLSFDRPLAEDEVNKYRDYIARRGKFEPLQYITGSVDFFNLTLNVSKDVLIPRQETEILIERAIELCKKNNYNSILDIGTGSGNIAIALAKELGDAKITAIDISEKAIEVAKKNAELNRINGTIDFISTDFVNFETDNKFDMIISNPPYVAETEYVKLQKEILEHEPKNAVTDNSDGYKYYKLITEKSPGLLENKGSLIFELAEGQSNVVSEIMNKNKFESIKIVKDYQGIDRVIYGKKI